MASRKNPVVANPPGGPANGTAAAADGESTDSALARRRRDDIVMAATDIIATEGIHRLSLGRIEGRLGMSRGQLTYYYPTKESILLAVFDRMLLRMIEEMMADAARSGFGPPGSGLGGSCYERAKFGLARMLNRPDGEKAELFSLAHTFQAQIRHRPDFRAKLAAANANWRSHIVADIEAMAPVPDGISAGAKASVIMALFQGLGDQLAVDPEALDRPGVLVACLAVLRPLLGISPESA